MKVRFHQRADNPGITYKDPAAAFNWALAKSSALSQGRLISTLMHLKETFMEESAICFDASAVASE
jgi:hypothetical protein